MTEEVEPRTIRVHLANGYTLSWTGDVEHYVTESGGLSVYDYGLRNRYPVYSGLIFSASDGAWLDAGVIGLATETKHTAGVQLDG